MKLHRILLLLLICSAMPGVDVGRKAATRKTEGETRILVFQSSEDKHESLQAKSPLTLHAQRSDALTIVVDDSVKYQEIDGFGASLTESSAWLLRHKLNDTQRRDALEMLFDRKKGIGLSMLRQPMGASD